MNSPDQYVRRGDQHRADGCIDDALKSYLQAVEMIEQTEPALALRLARCTMQLNQQDQTLRWLNAVVDGGEDFSSWLIASSLIQKLDASQINGALKPLRIAVLGSYTTTQWIPLLALACLRRGILADTYECDFGQYRQEVLNPTSGLYEFNPDVIVLAVHDREIGFPALIDEPDEAIEQELHNWTSLWTTAIEHTGARLIQHLFVDLSDHVYGHMARQLRGSRSAMMHALNDRLARAAGEADGVSIVDCESLAFDLGRSNWFDARYWHLSKQAVALNALPALAKHTAAVITGAIGLSKKCLVLDLDNTLWGGVIAEDGLPGISLGGTDARGEAFAAFQRYVKSLKDKGIILAVCSKNNDTDAREPFEQHPEMILSLDDIAMFVANWEPKPQNIRSIAKTLNIGIDSLVFVDDNPAEREIVRQIEPDVEVIAMPEDPALYVKAVSAGLWFETVTLTTEDASRTDQYKARAEAAQLESACTSLEDFYESLRMEAVIAPFDDVNLPRIAQLVGKSNQFNLTTRRHSQAQLAAFADDPTCVHRYLRLTDRFADHGLVSVLIAFQNGDELEIDTWLMSCRVIKRTVEDALLNHLCLEAQRRSCRSIRGTYLPTKKNELVRDIYQQFGFDLIENNDGATIWRYDLKKHDAISSNYIEVQTPESFAHDAA